MKKLFMVLPLVLLLCLTFSCQKGEEVAEEPAVDVEADIAAMKKIQNEFRAALNAGDIDKLVSLHSDDAVRIPPNKPALIGKEAIRGDFQQFFDQFTQEQENELVDVRVSGDLGYYCGTWTDILTPKAGGEPLKVNGSLVLINQKQPDGSWKTVFNSWSFEQLILPPPEKE
jgi:uncharacterized protein (TIGR02246 family)